MRAANTDMRFRIVFLSDRIPVRRPSPSLLFHGVVLRHDIDHIMTTITALTSSGCFGLPLPYLLFPAQDFRKISLGHPVLLFRCSPCLITYVQSHCAFRVLIAVCFPLDGTGLNHLMKTHPLNTPPRPNALHADALQSKTGRNPRSQALLPAASRRTR